ncbi:MAG: phage holin family protein [Candidatus Peribacteraceae bacterium]|nr:phage holin family protein [Candidatus Peribacteraceae bacterium]
MSKSFSNLYIKFTAGVSFSFVSFLFDSLQREALIALLVLIVFDFFSALLVSYKLGEAIHSSKVFRTALKTTVYFVLISAGFLVEKAIPIGMIDDIIIGFLAVTELISIMENAAKAGYSTPKGLLNTLRDYNKKK